MAFLLLSHQTVKALLVESVYWANSRKFSYTCVILWIYGIAGNFCWHFAYMEAEFLQHSHVTFSYIFSTASTTFYIW